MGQPAGSHKRVPRQKGVDKETTMASFDLFLPMLLEFEGGYVNDPKDRGGETNKGITMATFRECARELLGIEPTSENLKALTDTQAGIIYKARYWDKIHCDSIDHQNLANILCDFYVNAGAHATRLLQQTLNSMGGKLAVDGEIGPASIQFLSSVDQTAVYRQFKQGRIDYYQRLAQQFPTFIKGWLNRVNAFPVL
jgi:lysozyme family protein